MKKQKPSIKRETTKSPKVATFSNGKEAHNIEYVMIKTLVDIIDSE
jgi:hypothetical protein